jgi:hypothetical protein
VAPSHAPRTEAGEPTSQPTISPGGARAFLDLVIDVPRWWLALSLALAAVSSVSVDRVATGAFVVHFAVGATTIGAVALYWLPAVLRLLSLTGGRGKVLGVEAAAGGLASAPEALIAGLARIRTDVSVVERASPDVSGLAESVRSEVDRIAGTYLAGTDSLTADALAGLTRRYEHVRASQPRSPQRAIQMNQILDEARVRARGTPGEAATLAVPLLRSARDGDRVVGLAILQQEPRAEAFEDTLHLVQNGASAFEQYHALTALRAMAPLLSAAQRAQAASVLEVESKDPRGVGLADDPYIPSAIAAALAELRRGEITT